MREREGLRRGMIEDLDVFPLMQYEAEIGEENLAFFLSGFS